MQNEIQLCESNTAESIRCFPMMATTISTRNPRYQRMIMLQDQTNCLIATSLRTSIDTRSTVVSRLICTAPVANIHPAVNMTITALSANTITPAVMINTSRKNSLRLVNVVSAQSILLYLRTGYITDCWKVEVSVTEGILTVIFASHFVHCGLVEQWLRCCWTHDREALCQLPAFTLTT